MPSQRGGFLMLNWGCVLLSTCWGTDAPKLFFPNTVFVAFAGDELAVDYNLSIPAKQDGGVLMCFDPSNAVVFFDNVSATAAMPTRHIKKVKVKSPQLSGEYHCRYKDAKAYWFLHVRDQGYMEQPMMASTQLITVVTVMGVLLLVSLAGSVYVFRGHWKEQISKKIALSKEPKQSKERTRQPGNVEEDNGNAIPASSTSFYASLEPRPRSIYDELDHSAANTGPDTRKAAPKPKTPAEPPQALQSTESQDEGVFESVYENF